MPLGEVAKCFDCKALRSGEELRLDRTDWEYRCKDAYECRDKQERDADAIRAHLQGRKPRSKENYK